MKYKGKRVIGITGGIGSGKTRVLSILKDRYDALIIEADSVCRELQCPGEEVYYDIINTFGADILEPPCILGESAIDRRRLSNIVFLDKSKLNILNGITHPVVHKQIESIILQSHNKLIFIEAAILTETSLVNLTDEIWYIYADLTVRLDRLKRHRGISKAKALQIMASQPDDTRFRKRCDKIVDNSRDVEETLIQIDKLLNMDSDTI